MAWVLWLLAPVASTAVGAIVIWWRTPAETGHRLRRADAISEHQALLRALEQQSPSARNSPQNAELVAAEHPTAD